MEDGASVVVCDLGQEPGGEVQRQLGDRASFVAADVSVENEVAAVVDACLAQFGPPTILVSNAGVNANFDATTMTTDDWDRFMGVDLKAAWLFAKHVLPHMRNAARGAIVNVASMHAFVTLEGFFPYAAAKSGLIGLTRSLALDYGPHGIRVNAVAPGFIRTRLVQDSIDRHPDPAAAERNMVAGVALRRIGAAGGGRQRVPLPRLRRCQLHHRHHHPHRRRSDGAPRRLTWLYEWLHRCSSGLHLDVRSSSPCRPFALL